MNNVFQSSEPETSIVKQDNEQVNVNNTVQSSLVDDFKKQEEEKAQLEKEKQEKEKQERAQMIRNKKEKIVVIGTGGAGCNAADYFYMLQQEAKYQNEEEKEQEAIPLFGPKEEDQQQAEEKERIKKEHRETINKYYQKENKDLNKIVEKLKYLDQIDAQIEVVIIDNDTKALSKNSKGDNRLCLDRIHIPTLNENEIFNERKLESSVADFAIRSRINDPRHNKEKNLRSTILSRCHDADLIILVTGLGAKTGSSIALSTAELIKNYFNSVEKKEKLKQGEDTLEKIKEKFQKYIDYDDGYTEVLKSNLLENKIDLYEVKTVHKPLIVGVVFTPINTTITVDNVQDSIDEFIDRKLVDSLIVISNENIIKLSKNKTLDTALHEANQAFARSITGLANLVNLAGYINIDFSDMKTVMRNSGRTIISDTHLTPAELEITEEFKSIEGEYNSSYINYIVDKIIKNPLLEDESFTDAGGILLDIHANSNISASMINDIHKEFKKLYEKNNSTTNDGKNRLKFGYIESKAKCNEKEMWVTLIASSLTDSSRNNSKKNSKNSNNLNGERNEHDDDEVAD